MYGILSSKQLRMSDITKSNDYDEIFMFFPGIIDAMRERYRKDPFQFKFACEYGENAISAFLHLIYGYFRTRFDKGGVTNFVVCFAKTVTNLANGEDTLTMGRGYLSGSLHRN